MLVRQETGNHICRAKDGQRLGSGFADLNFLLYDSSLLRKDGRMKWCNDGLGGSRCPQIGEDQGKYGVVKCIFDI